MVKKLNEGRVRDVITLRDLFSLTRANIRVTIVDTSIDEFVVEDDYIYNVVKDSPTVLDFPVDHFSPRSSTSLWIEVSVGIGNIGGKLSAYKESKLRTRKRSIKEASEIGYGEYDEFKSEITDELESWGFEYSDDCHWDYFMPFGFYATYNARDGWAAIIWDNGGTITEIEKYSVNRLDTQEKADKFGSKCYNFSNYDMDTLIREGLILNGAVATKEDPWVFEYTDNAGDFWVIDLRNDEADVTYSNDGSTEHLEGMWDILSACGLIP